MEIKQIPKERLLAIINGEEPTSEEKDILLIQKQIVDRHKRDWMKKKEEEKAKLAKLKEDIELAKKNKNKRRNMRKKLKKGIPN